MAEIDSILVSTNQNYYENDELSLGNKDRKKNEYNKIYPKSDMLCLLSR